LNQGLEAKQQGRKLSAFFHTQKGGKERKREKKRDRKRDKKRDRKREKKREKKRDGYLLRARHAAPQKRHTPPRRNNGENARYNKRNSNKRIKTRSQTTRSSPHRKRTNTDLSKGVQREGGGAFHRAREFREKEKEVRARARFGHSKTKKFKRDERKRTTEIQKCRIETRTTRIFP
jgi:hypothetical protein